MSALWLFGSVGFTSLADVNDEDDDGAGFGFRE